MIPTLTIKVSGCMFGTDKDNKFATCKLYKGRPLPNTPKTYIYLGTASHNIGNMYNSNIMHIYKAADGSLRYGIYIDSSFYKFYGKLEVINN